MKLQIEKLVADSGEKVTGFIEIPKTNNKLPVTLIKGKETGARVLITAGIHNAEYTGIETALQLAREIRPEEITGALMIVHPVNLSGFENRTMSRVFEDGKNLNRLFPGAVEGTTGDRIAAFLVSNFLSQADYYLDLHGGDGFESLTPYVYYPGAAQEAVTQKSRDMASQINVPYMVKSMIPTGGAYNYAGSIGIPSILMERGSQGRWTEDEVILYKKDVSNILRYLGLLQGQVVSPKSPPADLVDLVYQLASFTGCWYPAKKAGAFVKKDEELGVVKDYFGKVLEICKASYDGIILYQVSSLAVIKNDPLITYGRLRE